MSVVEGDAGPDTSCDKESSTYGRRNFLRTGVAAAGALFVLADGGFKLIGTAQGAEKPSPPSYPHIAQTGIDPRIGVPNRKWIMVIDLAKCDGCRKCTKSCNKAHFVPKGKEWLRVFSMQDSPNSAPYWFPRPCFHCDEPPCTKICPVGATFKREDGLVLIDNTRCIGCRYCMAACPYSVREFNWGLKEQEQSLAMQSYAAEPVAAGTPALNLDSPPKYSPEIGYPRRIGTVEKCDFCPDLAARGILPDCVRACAMAAIYFGDENEDAVTNSKGETERLSKLLVVRAGYRYLEELGTKPRVYYLPPKDRMYPKLKEVNNEVL